MITTIYLTLGLTVLGITYFVLRPVASAYLRFRGTRVITCPERGEPTAVEVDAKHAAFTAGLGEPYLRLAGCTRWPEHQDCSQACLKQVMRGDVMFFLWRGLRRG